MSKVHPGRFPGSIRSGERTTIIPARPRREICNATTYKALADRLGLSPEQWTVQIETSTAHGETLSVLPGVAWSTTAREAGSAHSLASIASASAWRNFNRLEQGLCHSAAVLILIINQPSASSCRVDTVHVNEEIDLVSGHVVRPTREQIRRKINKKITQRSNSTDRNTDGGASTWGARRNTDRLGNGNGLTRVSP